MNVNPLRKDVVIIGGGIAGITAAMYASMMALDTVVIQKTPFLGQIPESSMRKNYPGLSNVTGEELARNIETQVKKDFSIEIKREEALDIVLNSGGVPHRFLVKTDYGNYLARTVILASGSRPKDIGVEDSNLKGISYYPMYDADEFEDKDVVIVGLSDAAVQFISWLLPIATTVTLVEKKAHPRVSPMNLELLEDLVRDNMEKIRFHRECSLTSFLGTTHVEGITIHHEAEDRDITIQTGAVILCSGRIPNSELGLKIGCDCSRKGFIIVDRNQRTNIPGLFAVGDVAGVVFAAVKSAGEGCVAGIKAADFLSTGNW
jgi:thioredoxin reductase (NADPH)